jgi:hypothetical protein
MKIAISLLLLLLMISCSTKESESASPEAISKEETAEMEQAVRQYFTTQQPPAKVFGIMPRRVSTHFVIRADIEEDGRRATRYVYYRQYNTQGNSYWKVEKR